MKKTLLPWLLLMILTSSLALTNSSFLLKHHQGDVNLSRLQGQETNGVKLNGSEGNYGRETNKDQGDLLVSEKGQRGKTGVFGGGNSAHRPHQKKSSATPRPCYIIAETTLYVSFSVVLILTYKLL
ncbi:uncharacterized protein LOC126798498 [Argentina anserina]|uniref:uncharacterized protein LOC126798498 n=1 Tax=Argentina anserina TaxID=57926 RepID=UPI00217644B6|nr:uncharacterized protein LOC126798498 [Potentilla anserina]